MNLILIAAAGAAPTTQGTVAPPAWLNAVPFVLLAIVLWIFMFRSNKNRNPKRNDMLANLKKGDEVQTIGGEFARVVDVKEDRVLLKVDETSNTKIWYSRNSIHRVVTDDPKANAK